MDIVAQIVTETVGQPKRKEFRVEELDRALSSGSQKKHVTLYPADYKSEWAGEGFLEIPNNVTVTIMPGAVVEYVDGFQFEDFQVPDGQGGTKTYEGDPLAPVDPNESSSHPLNYQQGDSEDSYAQRYAAPKFGGAVENITDLNLGSEWPLRQEFERAVWSVKGREPGEQFNDRDKVSFTVPYKGTFEVSGGRGGESDATENQYIYVETEELEGEDDGAKVIINHKEFNDFEDAAKENNPFNNTGTSNVIQTVSVNDGHLVDAQTVKVVERIGTKTDGKLDFTGNKGKLLVGHAETGYINGDGDPAPLPSVPSDDSGLGLETSHSVSIRTLESDNRGHIKNVEYGPNVEKVEGGRAIAVSGSNAVPEVGIDTSDLQGDKNISINDANPVDFTLNDATYREALSSDPSDPTAGEAVLWLSDGTDTGSDGDVLLKVTNGSGTTKTSTLFDFSSA